MSTSTRRRRRNVTITEEDVEPPVTAETDTSAVEAVSAKQVIDQMPENPNPTIQKPAVSRKRGGIIHRDSDIIASAPTSSGHTHSPLESDESVLGNLKAETSTKKKKKEKKNQVLTTSKP